MNKQKNKIQKENKNESHNSLIDRDFTKSNIKPLSEINLKSTIADLNDKPKYFKKIQKQDIFRLLIEKGNLIISGLDNNYNSYRVFEYQNKKFKLTLECLQ